MKNPDPRPYLITTAIAVVLFLMITQPARAQTVYFPVRGEAICPAANSAGLVIANANIQCLSNAGVVANPLRSPPGVKVTVNMTCPVHPTLNLTNGTAFHPNATGNAVTSGCTYTGAVYQLPGSVSVMTEHYNPAQPFEYQLWCSADGSHGLRVNATQQSCRLDDGSFVAPSTHENIDALAVTFRGVCPEKTGTAWIETRALLTGGQASAICMYSDSTQADAIRVSADIQPHRQAAPSKLAALLMSYMSVISGLLCGWKLSITPTIRLME